MKTCKKGTKRPTKTSSKNGRSRQFAYGKKLKA